MSVIVPAGSTTKQSAVTTLAADIALPTTAVTLINVAVPKGTFFVFARGVIVGATAPGQLTVQITGMSAANKWVPDANAYSLDTASIWTFGAASSIWLSVWSAVITGATVKRLDLASGLGATQLGYIRLA